MAAVDAHAVERARRDRRTGDGPAPALGRLRAALLDGLCRRLAADDDRAAYWVRHVRHGVVLSGLTATAVAGYALVTDSPGRHSAVILALAAVAVLVTPALLLLPLQALVRDRRGPLLFYLWSSAVTAMVVLAARADGGADSPIFVVLLLTLAFMAVAYPPYGVLAMGAVMTGSYLFLVAAPAPDTSAVFVAVVMGVYTVLCALASANQWEAHDRQALLLRTSEMLAATDPLTGCLNRRVFLDRLARAVEAADGQGRTVVCVVDLDGFKAVNDRDGHAAGDATLRTVTTALAGVVRETDTVARLGGDEFAVLAAVPGPGDGERLADRLRDAVARVGAGTGVTASVGTTPVLPGDCIEDVLGRADRAMYRAKGAGGDRVVAHSAAARREPRPPAVGYGGSPAGRSPRDR